MTEASHLRRYIMLELYSVSLHRSKPPPIFFGETTNTAEGVAGVRTEATFKLKPKAQTSARDLVI